MNKMLHSAVLFLVLAIALPGVVLSADEAVTTADPEIPQDDLKLMLKPLRRAELKVEADAWLQLLESKVKEISTAEIAVKGKLREVSSAEKVEAALDDVEAAKNKAAEPMDAAEAKKSIQDAEKALEDAIADARVAIARVTGNAETTRVTAIAALVG